MTSHQESSASAAIDGARIAVYLAQTLVAADEKLPGVQRALLLEHLDQARGWLDGARDLFPVETTSVHAVQEGVSIGIIEVARR